MIRLSLTSALVALMTTSGACSLIVNIDSIQCNEQSDCAALGYPDHQCDEDEKLCVANPAFACREVPFPDSDLSISVPYTLSVVNLVGLQPYEGLTVKACPAFNSDCDQPIDETVTDGEGLFTLGLHEGFRGHLFVPKPMDDPDLVPLKAHIFPPPSSAPDAQTRPGLVVTKLEDISELAMDVETPLDPTRGHIFFTAQNCLGEALAGITISSPDEDEETLIAYLGNSFQPDLSLAATSAVGQGAAINLSPGFVTIRGEHVDRGLLFEQSVIVAAGTITSVPIVPSSPTE